MDNKKATKKIAKKILNHKIQLDKKHLDIRVDRASSVSNSDIITKISDKLKPKPSLKEQKAQKCSPEAETEKSEIKSKQVKKKSKRIQEKHKKYDLSYLDLRNRNQDSEIMKEFNSHVRQSKEKKTEAAAKRVAEMEKRREENARKGCIGY